MAIMLETSRFRLREMEAGDLEILFRLDSDPVVHRYLGNHPVTSRDEITGMILYVRKQYAENGFGRWMVEVKATGECAGWAGLKRVHDNVNNRTGFVDLGYRLLPEFWGQGIATECSAVSLDYGFNSLHLTEISAAAHVQNDASNHILRKLGFQKAGTFLFHGSENNWYDLSEADWRLNRAP